MMNTAKETALSIARCENFFNETCKGFIEYQKTNGVLQIPEPWNGDIEKAEYLFISSNPSYNPKEKDYPAPDCSDEEIYDFFKNRFINKHPDEGSRFWKRIDKTIHWINAIYSGETDIEKILKYAKSQNYSNYDYPDRICVANICHCKSTYEKYVKENIDTCVKKHLINVVSLFHGKIIFVIGSQDNQYTHLISTDKDNLVVEMPHPNARVKDYDRIRLLLDNYHL